MPQDEALSLDLSDNEVNRLLFLHADDLRNDEAKHITGPYFQSRAEFHQRFFDWYYAEPKGVRFRLVKVIGLIEEKA